jgi:hypothetical protein
MSSGADIKEQLGKYFVEFCQNKAPQFNLSDFSAILTSHYMGAKVAEVFLLKGIEDGLLYFTDASEGDSAVYWRVTIQEESFLLPKPVAADRFDCGNAFAGFAFDKKVPVGPLDLDLIWPAVISQVNEGWEVQKFGGINCPPAEPVPEPAAPAPSESNPVQTEEEAPALHTGSENMADASMVEPDNKQGGIDDILANLGSDGGQSDIDALLAAAQSPDVAAPEANQSDVDQLLAGFASGAPLDNDNAGSSSVDLTTGYGTQVSGQAGIDQLFASLSGGGSSPHNSVEIKKPTPPVSSSARLDASLQSLRQIAMEEESGGGARSMNPDETQSFDNDISVSPEETMSSTHKFNDEDVQRILAQAFVETCQEQTSLNSRGNLGRFRARVKELGLSAEMFELCYIHLVASDVVSFEVITNKRKRPLSSDDIILKREEQMPTHWGVLVSPYYYLLPVPPPVNGVPPQVHISHLEKNYRKQLEVFEIKD